MSSENLVIMHHFLKRSNYFISKALEVNEVSNQPGQHLELEGLRNQVPKDQRGTVPKHLLKGIST